MHSVSYRNRIRPRPGRTSTETFVPARGGVSWYHLLSPYPLHPCGTSSPIFRWSLRKMGEARWGSGLGSRCNGRYPGSLTAWDNLSDRPTPLRERLPCRTIWQIALQNTGGEFTAWLPASHQTGRSLNSCADTYLRVGLLLLMQHFVMGWIIHAWGGMSSSCFYTLKSRSR